MWKDYPNEIRFLFSLQSVYLPERFEISPISDLLSKFVSKPSKEIYRDIANSNKEYDLHKDFIETLKKAEAGDTRLDACIIMVLLTKMIVTGKQIILKLQNGSKERKKTILI